MNYLESLKSCVTDFNYYTELFKRSFTCCVFGAAFLVDYIKPVFSEDRKSLKLVFCLNEVSVFETNFFSHNDFIPHEDENNICSYIYFRLLQEDEPPKANEYSFILNRTDSFAYEAWLSLYDNDYTTKENVDSYYYLLTDDKNNLISTRCDFTIFKSETKCLLHYLINKNFPLEKFNFSLVCKWYKQAIMFVLISDNNNQMVCFMCRDKEIYPVVMSNGEILNTTKNWEDAIVLRKKE